MERGILMGVSKRSSGLNKAGTAQKLAHSIHLPRDRAFMNSLTLSNLLDRSMIDSLRVSFVSLVILDNLFLAPTFLNSPLETSNL